MEHFAVDHILKMPHQYELVTFIRKEAIELYNGNGNMDEYRGRALTASVEPLRGRVQLLMVPSQMTMRDFRRSMGIAKVQIVILLPVLQRYGGTQVSKDDR